MTERRGVARGGASSGYPDHARAGSDLPEDPPPRATLPVRCLIELGRPRWLDAVLLGDAREFTAPLDSGGSVRWSVVRVRLATGERLDVATCRVRTLDGRRLDRARPGPRSREDALGGVEAVEAGEESGEDGGAVLGAASREDGPIVERRRSR